MTEINTDTSKEPNILTSEITHAINLAKTQKAAAPEDIYVEMLKLVMKMALNC